MIGVYERPYFSQGMLKFIAARFPIAMALGISLGLQFDRDAVMAIDTSFPSLELAHLNLIVETPQQLPSIIKSVSHLFSFMSNLTN